MLDVSQSGSDENLPRSQKEARRINERADHQTDQSAVALFVLWIEDRATQDNSRL